jgi:hypothetical protein
MVPGLLATDSGAVDSRSQIRIIHERNQQGLGHVILELLPEDRVGETCARFRRRKRLGGLLNFCYRKAV